MTAVQSLKNIRGRTVFFICDRKIDCGTILISFIILPFWLLSLSFFVRSDQVLFDQENATMI